MRTLNDNDPMPMVLGCKMRPPAIAPAEPVHLPPDVQWFGNGNQATVGDMDGYLATPAAQAMLNQPKVAPMVRLPTYRDGLFIGEKVWHKFWTDWAVVEGFGGQGTVRIRTARGNVCITHASLLEPECPF